MPQFLVRRDLIRPYKTPVVVSSGSGWDPTDEASCLWGGDGEKVSISGSDVNFTDRVSAHNADNALTGGKPDAVSLAGQNVWDFDDAVPELLVATGGSTTTYNDLLVVMLVEIDSASSPWGLFGIGANVVNTASSGMCVEILDGATPQVRLRSNGDTMAGVNFGYGSQYVLSFLFSDGGGTPALETWVNGTSGGTGSPAGTRSHSIEDVVLFTRRSDAAVRNPNGRLAGMYVFNTTSTDIRQDAEGYFAHFGTNDGSLLDGISHPHDSVGGPP